MKKLFALFLCFVLVLSFVACGGESAPAVELEETEVHTEENVDAYTAAVELLALEPFSRPVIVDYLIGEGFSEDEAKAATALVNWKEQALRKAEWYLSVGSSSRKNLIFVLTYFNHFTSSEAQYAVDNCGADWCEQALKRAKEEIAEKDYSYDKLIEFLVEKCDYTFDEATYAADNCGVDWIATE